MDDCGVLGANKMAYITRIVLGIFNVITSFTATTGNLLIICVILYYKPLRRRSNYLILCLAVTDLAVGILLQPMASAQIINEKAGNDCYLAYAVTYAGAMLCGASSWTLALISYDRYLRLVKLQNYTNYMSERKLYMMIAFCWLYPVLLGFLMFTDATIDIYYGILVFSANVNIVIIAVCYRSSWRFIREKSKILPREIRTQLSKAEDQRLTRHWRVAKTFALIICCFLLCWTPMVAFVVYLIVQRNAKLQLGSFSEYIHTVYYITLLSGYSNSTLNPFIYFWRNKELKAGMKHFVLSVILRQPIAPDESLSANQMTQTSNC